jgi:hypothetical protein
MSMRPITVAETPFFLRQASSLWGEDEHDAFVDFIARNPDAGDRISDAGGLRKVRWKRPGTGKRGGVRVIYFYHDPAMPLYLLLIYAKAETHEEKRRARALIEGIKREHGRR